MIALFTKDKKRFRASTDEWWVLANWNFQHVLVFSDSEAIKRYCAKHAINEWYEYPLKDPYILTPSFELRQKKEIATEYDESNKSHYVVVAVLHYYDPAADEKLTSSVDRAFANLNAALAFYAHMANHDWYIENEHKANQCWSLDLAPGNPHDAYKVTLHEVLLVKQ